MMTRVERLKPLMKACLYRRLDLAARENVSKKPFFEEK